MVEKLLFYVRILLFYKNKVVKKTAFLQKYIFCKKVAFYIKILLFYKLIGCKKKKKKKKRIKLTAKTVDEDPASCKRWISRKEIKSAKI